VKPRRRMVDGFIFGRGFGGVIGPRREVFERKGSFRGKGKVMREEFGRKSGAIFLASDPSMYVNPAVAQNLRG
jgi:hypothetical protein